ncbi:MAG: SpoIIE family protein phosphatase [Clostridiales bacterium]|jgi:hypothetical protein|nr:SpoIIE family protein phosphatase [Clostridiales bacterium]
MKNKKAFATAKYLCFFVSFAVFFKAEQTHYSAPFAVGLFAAFAYAGQNILLLAPLYIAAALISGAGATAVVTALFPPVVFTAAYYIRFKLKKKVGLPTVCLCVFLSRLPILFFADGDKALLNAAVSVALSVLSAYAASLISGAVTIRRVRLYKAFTTDEKAALILLSAAFALGLYGIGSPVFYCAAAAVIMLALALSSPPNALAIAAIAGISAAFFDGSLMPLTFLICTASAAAALRPLSLYFSGIGILCVCILSLVFSFADFHIGLYDLTGIALGLLVFFIFQKKSLPFLSAFTNHGEKKELSERGIVNNSRIIMRRKLSGLRAAFFETSAALKVCVRDETARALAVQLDGVAEIFGRLAAESAGGMSFDANAERRLTEALAAANIVCLDAAVYNSDELLSVLIIVRERDVKNPSLSRIVCETVGQRLVIASADMPFKGCAAIEYKTADGYDVVFGEAHQSRGKVSGDVKSAFKIQSGKFIAVLSDGMGHGGSAHRIGETAVNLIENFYRAGFGGETLLPLINRVLCGIGGGVFATLDTCVIDLKTASAAFIKMGAHDGYIKRGKAAQVVENDALPLGALNETHPAVAVKTLLPDDFVILVSDGIGDAFLDGGLHGFIASFNTKNPQAFADAILTEAVRRGVRDDLSVIVMRIYRKL